METLTDQPLILARKARAQGEIPETETELALWLFIDWLFIRTRTTDIDSDTLDDWFDDVYRNSGRSRPGSGPGFGG